MKKRKKKKRVFVLLFIFVVFVVAIYVKENVRQIQEQVQTVFHIAQDYPTIKQDSNENYNGPGQEKVKNKDGYFTVFTTSEPEQKTYVEYKQNLGSWQENAYWDANMAESGCGITALSIILSGYGQDYTPEMLREKYYPVLDGDNIATELFHTFGIQNSGFCYDAYSLSADTIQTHLRSNRPVLVCVWDKPTENRWTTASHYMVLLASDSNDLVYVSNPNGLKNNAKSSGWYPISEITPYLAKVLFIQQEV